jgi:hypothetical protein
MPRRTATTSWSARRSMRSWRACRSAGRRAHRDASADMRTHVHGTRRDVGFAGTAKRTHRLIRDATFCRHRELPMHATTGALGVDMIFRLEIRRHASPCGTTISTKAPETSPMTCIQRGLPLAHRASTAIPSASRSQAGYDGGAATDACVTKCRNRPAARASMLERVSGRVQRDPMCGCAPKVMQTR